MTKKLVLYGIMNRFRILYITVIFFFSVSSASAGIWQNSVTSYDFNDQRTFTLNTYNPPTSEGGLEGYWPAFTISWDITYDSITMLWTYEYTLSAIKKDISHFILEVSEGTTKEDFINLSINETPATFDNKIEGPSYWGRHPSNPGYPTSIEIYGIKFDIGDNPVTYSFMTVNDPVWGNFYSKGGKHKDKWIHAYNTALAIDDFNSDNPIDFIVRPGDNNTPIIPEPLSSLLFVSGGAILVIRHFYRKIRKLLHK
jgi:hypothetical protein